MKKKKNILIVIAFIFVFGLCNINSVFARSGGADYTLSEIHNDPSLASYVVNLMIHDSDLQYLSELGSYSFDSLEYVDIVADYIPSNYKIKFSKATNSIEHLYINSVLDISIIDLEPFKKVSFSGSYNLGTIIDNDKIDYSDFENPEYYKFTKYSDRLDAIAKEIYDRSDKTTKGIIKEVTLYVIDNMDSADYELYSHLEELDAILNHNTGVCGHYARLESELLNRLGIFALEVSGYTDINNQSNTGHVWNVVYVDNHWYYIDPIQLDGEVGRENLVNGVEMVGYMSAIDNSDFNRGHYLTTDYYEHIPISERYSKISILNNVSMNVDVEEETVDNPNTGLYIGIFGLILVLLSLVTMKKQNKFNRI